MKNKYVVLAGVCLGLLVLVGGGFWIWHGRQDTGSELGSRRSLDESDQAPTQNSIPLNQAGAVPEDSGGLSVSSSNASSSIGQLDGSGSKANASAGSGSSDSSSASSSIDPTTFSQYDKYKDAQGALFGDAKVGTGAEALAGKKVAVYYRGWLTNGQLFDESRAGSDGRLEAFIFTLGEHKVIPGWEQGIMGMKVGGVRLLIVPPAVGYGSTGQGSIPPNSVLVFQVQLLEVQ